jgi:hypothetical protein
MKGNIQVGLDKAGVLLSGLCTVHCLMTPLLVAFAPSVSVFFKSEWLHIGLVLAILPIALVAFIRGKNAHGDIRPLILGVLGILCLITALAAEEFQIEGAEKLLTVLGSLFLIVAHSLNFFSRKGVK